MNKKTRKVLFYTSIILFGLLSVVVVLFSLGYKYDFINNKLVKTGSFRLASNTGGAAVYLDSKLIGKTSFLTDNFSKGRYLPRTYSARLEKDGYKKWEKNIVIKSGFFTDFPSIILIKNTLQPEFVASFSANFKLAAYDESKQIAYFLNNKSELLAINLNDLSKKELTGISRTALGQELTAVNDVFYYKKNDIFYSYSLSDKKQDVILAGLDSAFLDKDKIFYSSSGSLKYVEINSSDEKILIEDISDNREVIKVKKIENGHILLLGSSNTQTLYILRDGQLTELDSDVENFNVSHDQDKIAYFANNELWVSWIRDTSSQPTKKEGDRELITRFSKPIEKITWHKNSEYLLVKSGDIIRFIEIDGRGGGRNIYDLTSIEGEFIYLVKDSDIFWLKNNALLKISLD